MNEKTRAILEGERAARALRQELGLSFAPLHSIWDVIEARDVTFAVHDFGPNGGDGLYLRAAPTSVIVVNGRNRLSRQRFTAAHELGHHELHRFDSDQAIVVDKNVYDNSGDVREIAANAFAGYLLAPTEGLKEAFSSTRTPSVEDVVRQTMRWGTSFTAMVFRLHNAGVITARWRKVLQDSGAGQVDFLLKHLGATPDIPPVGYSMRPPSFLEAVMKLYQGGMISPNRMAELTDQSPDAAVLNAAQAGHAPADTPIMAAFDDDDNDLFDL